MKVNWKNDTKQDIGDGVSSNSQLSSDERNESS
jgi:hypothetical protein